MTHPPSRFWPQGTVYGTLLNMASELRSLGDQAAQPPYKAPPKAPVLYVKTANTWTRCGDAIPLPAHVPQVEVWASVAMVMGEPRFDVARRAATPWIAGYVLVNDLSVPHHDFFRPPVKTRCLDGFLGLGPSCVAPPDAGDTARLVLEVRVNGVLRQTVRFAEAVRDAARLLADVSGFMTLRPGDLLMLGSVAGRPLAAAGDQISIRAPGVNAFGILDNTLVATAREAA